MAIFQSRIWLVSCIVMLHLHSKIIGARIPIEEMVVPPNVCTSQECINEARAIYEYRNISVKPCDDFYEFVCGGWSSSHPVTEDRGYRNTYWDLTELNTERVRDILEADSYPSEPEFVKKVKTFYQSCLNRDDHASRNLEILIQRLDWWGGWPIATEEWMCDKFDWKKLLLHLTMTNDIYPLFKIYVGSDQRNATQPRLTIEQADDTYCWDHEKKTREEKLKESIVKIALHIANATNQNISKDEIDKEADKIIRLDEQICKIRQKDKNRLLDSARFYIRTVEQLQNLTDSVEPVNEYTQIEWLQLLNDFLQDSTMKIDEDEEVVMINPDFFPKLVELIDNTPQRTLANYLLWYHIEWMEAGKWLEFIEDDFLSDQNATKTNSNNKEERWKTCAEETNKDFLHAIGYLYVKMYLGEDIKQEVGDLAQSIHNSFVEDLKKNKWMDHKTRALAVEKANHIKYLIGYPDWYNTSGVNKLYRQIPLEDNYIINIENIKKRIHQEDLDFFDGTQKDYDLWSSVTVADAYNIYQISSVEIYAANFQSPIYLKGRPEALNYGALGSTIGHEITHSFDDIGRKYDGLGILKNWWTNESLKRFKTKTQCIEEIYSEYPTPELDEEEAWRLDGPGTITENIADIGGLEIALSAYKKYLRKHGPEKQLPGLTQFTSEQLFFIGYGLQFCQSTTPEDIAETILIDEHTPQRYRTLLTVSNSKDFAEVWNCKAGDKMNAPKKCPFW